jgi:hypothetical protein
LQLITNVCYEPSLCHHHKSSTLKTEAVGSTEASVNIFQTTKYHIPEDSNLHVLNFSESQYLQDPGQINADILRNVRYVTISGTKSRDI